jgi:hypothetical protein
LKTFILLILSILVKISFFGSDYTKQLSERIECHHSSPEFGAAVGKAEQSGRRKDFFGICFYLEVQKAGMHLSR